MVPSAKNFAASLAALGFPEGGKALVAFSGGPDSSLLLELAVQAFPGRVTAAHYDHRLRPESGEDAAFCRARCAELGIPFFAGRGDVAARAKKEKRGVEETARAMRYAFLETARKKAGADAILTGHNLDDQAETVLFRAARGTKLAGLGGIPPKTGHVLRPLLGATKTEIISELERREVPFRTDASNADGKYSRNFLRSEVLPLLAAVNPKAREALGRLAAYCRDLSAWVEGELAPVLRDDGHFGLADYKALPGALRGDLLRMVFSRVAGSGEGLTEANLAELDRFLHGRGNPSGKEMFGVRLEKRGQAVTFGAAGKPARPKTGKIKK